jgi:hypothetical protein
MSVKNWAKEEMAKRFPNDNVIFLNTYLDMYPSNFDAGDIFPRPMNHYKQMSIIVENIRINSNKAIVIPDNKPMVVVTPRHKQNIPERNWGANNWERLVDILLKEGFAVAIHGARYDTASINIQSQYIINNIGVDLETQVAYLGKAKMAFSSISGALIVSVYAGCPVVTFGSQDYIRMATVEGVLSNNPLKTPVYSLTKGNTWNYSPEEVYSFSKQYLK